MVAGVVAGDGLRNSTLTPKREVTERDRMRNQEPVVRDRFKSEASRLGGTKSNEMRDTNTNPRANLVTRPCVWEMFSEFQDSLIRVC